WVAGSGGFGRIPHSGEFQSLRSAIDRAPLVGWTPDSEPGRAEVGMLGFQLSSAQLTAFDGAERFVRFGFQDHQFWQRWAPSSVHAESGFVPQAYSDQMVHVVQSRDGRWYAFDAISGATRFSGPAPRQPWSGPPVAIGEDSLAIVEPTSIHAL